MENAIRVQVSVEDWLKLPMITRVKLREIFAIPKSQGALVEGSVVKSDGTTYYDLQAITVGKMQLYLEDPTVDDFVQLFNGCVEKIQQIDKELEPAKVDPKQVILDEWASRLADMVYRAGNLSMTHELKTLINKLLPNDQEKIVPLSTQTDKRKPGRPKATK